MPAAEFALWIEHYQRYGFDTDRLEHATANAGAAACRVWGGDVKPADLIPRFGANDPAAKLAAIKAFFEGLTPDKFGGKNGG